MSAWLLSLVAIVVIGMSLVTGYRRGARRQIPRVIALCVGIVCARIFCIPASRMLMEAFPYALGCTETGYTYSTMAAGGVFCLAYMIFNYTTGFIGRVLRRCGQGVLDSIAGALISLTVYVMFLSVSYNCLLCLNPRGELMKSMQASDGNILEEVLMVSPVLLGTETPEDLRHKQQLEDASHISRSSVECGTGCLADRTVTALA